MRKNRSAVRTCEAILIKDRMSHESHALTTERAGMGHIWPPEWIRVMIDRAGQTTFALLALFSVENGWNFACSFLLRLSSGRVKDFLKISKVCIFWQNFIFFDFFLNRLYLENYSTFSTFLNGNRFFRLFFTHLVSFRQ